MVMVMVMSQQAANIAAKIHISLRVAKSRQHETWPPVGRRWLVVAADD